MTKKSSKKHNQVDLSRPFCYYCERDFEDLKVLTAHQRAKHFKWYLFFFIRIIFNKIVQDVQENSIQHQVLQSMLSKYIKKLLLQSKMQFLGEILLILKFTEWKVSQKILFNYIINA